MSLETRLKLYAQVEARRKRPLIVYVTSNRQGANGQIASDTVPELLNQLQRLPPEATGVDLLIVSDGGDPTVAWRIVSLIRERAKSFSVLVPQAAYSAATLIVLGADEVVMHPHGNLGPTDPQITVPRKGKDAGSSEAIRFGSEDLAAFLRFSKDIVGLTDQAQMTAIYTRFCDEVGTVAVGVAARSSLLTVTMGEKLLQLHMTDDTHKQRARAISEKLTKDFFHHGYPVNRSEAKEIGLKVTDRDEHLEGLMWQIWCDISEELRLREPHNPIAVLRADPNCAALFSPQPMVNIPIGLPPPLAQQALQAALAQVQIAMVPPASFENIHAVMESSRYASRYILKGMIFATRQADQQLRLASLVERQGWVTSLPIPTQAQAAAVGNSQATAAGGPAAGAGSAPASRRKANAKGRGAPRQLAKKAVVK